MEKARQFGLDAYEADLNEKIAVLEELLKSYDDGRNKSFFCLAVNLFDLQDINDVMYRIGNTADPAYTLKEKAAVSVRLIKEIAEERGISLKLRKKNKA